ncbi:hypothetical protein IQE94_15420 [Synechocystis sp. PCC 7339]|uniref:hypothetical protein n=1 Tax=unclassified Synechocystis TaxID=2640012 RepID=UPI001BAFB1F2|nr:MULTISPECIES: hypothetical protein [unclassified Synechocystis]QUS60115.1 hypothetical protein HTZ78_05135 [Synechocystis sp. PCC 7338]UAJ72437.1 hypothetical protein IQE94_15420 [Synechocystis sp. PCC 7339]
MENPLQKVEAAINHQVSETVRQTSDKFYGQLEKIVHKELTSDHLERIIADAVAQTLRKLVWQYWYLLLAAVCGLLVIQALLLRMVLKDTNSCVEFGPRSIPPSLNTPQR